MAIPSIMAKQSISLASVTPNRDDGVKTVPVMAWLVGGPEDGSLQQYLEAVREEFKVFATKYRPLLREGLDETQQNDCLQQMLTFDFFRSAQNFFGDRPIWFLSGFVGGAIGAMIGGALFERDKTFNFGAAGVGAVGGAAIAGTAAYIIAARSASRLSTLRHQLLEKCMDESALATFEASISSESGTDNGAEFSSAAPFKNPLAGQLRPIAIPRISGRDVAAVREAMVYEPSLKRTATRLYSELVNPLGTINNTGTAAGESATGLAALGALLMQAAARGFVPVP